MFRNAESVERHRARIALPFAHVIVDDEGNGEEFNPCANGFVPEEVSEIVGRGFLPFLVPVVLAGGAVSDGDES